MWVGEEGVCLTWVCEGEEGACLTCEGGCEWLWVRGVIIQMWVGVWVEDESL